MTDYTVDDYAQACRALALGEPVQYRKIDGSLNQETCKIPPAFDIARAINWRAVPKPPKTKKLYPYAYKDSGGLWKHGGWNESPDARTASRYSHSKIVRINDDGTIDVPEDV